MSCCDLSVAFGLGSAGMFSTVRCEAYFSCRKVIWISAFDNYIFFLPNCAVSIGSYTSIIKQIKFTAL